MREDKYEEDKEILNGDKVDPVIIMREDKEILNDR